MIIEYKFTFEESGRVEIIELKFDDSSLTLIPDSIPVVKEPWMKLDYHRCSNCTLPPDSEALCPVAANLGSVIRHFQNDFSYSKVTTVVSIRKRKVGKKSDLQDGLSSMIGLIMATSGCPQLDMLRPMAYTHQPFATMEETFFRAVSAYLMAQYIRLKHQAKPEYDLAGLKQIYHNISELNTAFNHRLRQFKGKDANLNALVMLDVFAQMGSFTISDEWLENITPLFYRYLDR